MERTENEKTKTELSRIPSPSSVSSVHSIKPLEWDSGADIGYQCELQPGLSTVERIALVSGTVNLFETCKTGDLFDTSFKKYQFGNPVAQSSPFVANLNVISKSKKSISAGKKSGNSENIDKRSTRPLVEYSISSDHSIDEKTENSAKSINCVKITEIEQKGPQNSLLDRSSNILTTESSKSLDDLRYLNRLRRLTKSVSYKSRSSQNIYAGLNHKNSNGKNRLNLKNSNEKSHLSSSSVSTVISHDDKNSNLVPDPVRKFSNKSIQVDEACLDQSSDSTKSNTDVFKNVYRNEGKSESSKSNRNYPTYTIKDSYRFFQLLNKYCDMSDCGDTCEESDKVSGSNQSNTESLEGGSFEYVPGSAYDISNKQSNSCTESSKESSSEVNTLCTEVVDGVDLITKYVDNLRVSNKRKVIRKMTQFLINNLASDDTHNSTDSELRENVSSLFLNSNPEFGAKSIPSTERSDRSASLSKSNTESNSRAGNSSDIVPKIRKDNFKRRKSPDEKDGSSREFSASGLSNSVNFSGNRGVMSQSSVPEETTASSRTCNSSSSSTIPNCKIQSSDSNSSNIHALKQYLTKERDAQLLWIKSGIDHLNNLKKLYESQRIRRKNLNTLKKIQNNNIGSTNERSCNCDCNCSCQVCDKKIIYQQYDVSENKENISDFSKISNRWPKRKEANKSGDLVVRKQPVSYTVIFDKKPTIFTNKNFIVREQTVRKSVSKTYLKKNKMRKTTSTTELRGEQNETKLLSSLQEYLLKNKPKYVEKAEIRRQCLFEIAKLRELRDKSRNELLSVLNTNDSNDNVSSKVPPPPLSVLRIFNDKYIRRQTEKKYQQLPEVQNKKLELKRKECYRTNQIMAKVFTRKLQKKVLQGQVNLGNSVNVIST